MPRTYPVVQWLRLWASTAGGICSIPGWGTRTVNAAQHGKKNKLINYISVFTNTLIIICSKGKTNSQTIWRVMKRSTLHIKSYDTCSVTQLCPTLWTQGLQHTRPLCPSPSPRACSKSCPLSWWCHPTISSSVIHFSSCLRSFLALESFLMSQPLTKA